MRAEMRPLDDTVEAEPVGGADEVEIVAQMPGGVTGRVLAADDQAQLHSDMPLSANSFLALSFLGSERPMPLSTLGALVNGMVDYSMISSRLPQGARKSRN